MLQKIINKKNGKSNKNTGNANKKGKYLDLYRIFYKSKPQMIAIKKNQLQNFR